MKTYPVVVQEWLESEAGWGCRPDGFSVHLSEEDRKEYCKRYWARQPKGLTPHKYSREDGPPTVMDVSEAGYQHVCERKRDGFVCLRVWNRQQLNDLRPPEIVQKEQEKHNQEYKAYSMKLEEDLKKRKLVNELLYGKDYDPNRGWK